ncbi:MAG: TonB-dependent receptor [Pseudomonadota bacterium]
MIRIPPFPTVAVIVLFCQVAQASDIESIVVTASRLERPATELTQSATVIGRDEIDARQLANVTELLRHVAGLNVVQQGGRGGVTSVVLRGGESNFTVVLIDGIKVNDPTNTRGGSYDFSYLDIGSVERVEIIRGPMSALYGSDALAGVINIVTRTDVDGVAVNAEVGGHGLQSARFAMGGDIGAANGVITVHALNEDGDIEGASYDDWGLNGSLRFNVGESADAGVQLRYQNAQSWSFPEDSGGPVYALLREVDRRDVEESHVRLFFNGATGPDWRTRIALSHYERNENAVSPGIAPGVFDGVPPNGANSEFSRNLLSVGFSRELGDDASLALGAEWQNEDGESNGFLDFGFPLPTNFGLERDTLSAFAELEYAFGDVQLQASLRWDDPDDISSETSAQFGVLYPLPENSGALRVNWSEAFKAPSFFALAHPLVGNPDLVPETAVSLDVGYRRSFGTDARIDVSVYRSEFENLIDFDPMLFTNVNRSKVISKGVELTAEWAVSASIGLNLHASYLDTDIKDSDARLRSRPRWRGGIDVDWRLDDRWLLTAGYLTLAEFWEASIPTGGLFLDGYQRVDLALTFDASERLKLGLAVDNALDEDYAEAVGFPGAGMRGRINATYRF